MNPRRGMFFRKYAGGRCQVKISGRNGGTARQPALVWTNMIACSDIASPAPEEGASAQLVCLSASAADARACILLNTYAGSAHMLVCPKRNPTPYAVLASLQVRCEPKSTIGH